MNNAKHFDAGGELTAVLSTVSRLAADVLQAFRSTIQGGDSVQRLVILFD